METVNFKISEVYYDEKVNDYIISISVLLRKENGSIKGIIRADISFLSFIQEIEVDLELFDLSQLILVCNEHKKIMYKSGTYNILEDVSEEKYFNNIKSHKGYFSLKENNEIYIYSYAKKNYHFKLVPDFSVIIKNSSKEIFNPLNKILLRSFFIISFLMIVLFIFMIFMVRSILWSVKNLQEGARIIGNGDLYYQIKSISKDELNEVVISFNEMTENLRKIIARKDELENEIKKRNKAEELLRKSEERFRSTLDNMLEGAQIIGKDWRYLYLNDAAEKHGRCSKKELLGNKYMDMWRGAEKTKLFRLMKRCMEKKESYYFENEFIYLDGKKGWFDISIQPVAEGIFILSMDITKRKQAEEKIKRLYKDLERRVALRTSQLETSNKELEAFAYSISHDLRTPLRAIHGYSTILVSDYGDKLGKEANEYLQRNLKNVNKMEQLIEDLLEFSRASRRDINKTKIDIKDLILDVYKDLMRENEKKDVMLELKEIIDFSADKIMIQQVFSNFISNALKFSKKTENALIEIGASKNKNEIIYYIKDNGVGFDEAYKDKLFGVFQRLHSVNDFEGTGIGLAIVYRIISKHGGKVWAESEVNKGATFYFSVPVN